MILVLSPYAPWFRHECAEHADGTRARCNPQIERSEGIDTPGHRLHGVEKDTALLCCRNNQLSSRVFS